VREDDHAGAEARDERAGRVELEDDTPATRHRSGRSQRFAAFPVGSLPAASGDPD
jgi:hypothetical protein